MGIRHLNKFLRTNCPNSIACINMKEISGKKIAIDVSIYLYKFAADNTLIENMYLMLSIFRYYQITPVFIFDGKPPDEKKQVLEKRKSDKVHAKKEFQELKKQLETDEHLDHDEKQEISIAMDLLKKKFIYIQKEQIDQVKELMRAFGATYFDAPGEADELCALLAIKKKVWACMSEDMDLFVYGCPRVLRYFSLLKHNVVIYNTKRMLEELGLLEKEFRQICILSGTDYNKNGLDLYSTLKLFKKYYKTKINTTNANFYDWLLENTSHILDYSHVQKIDDLFNLCEKKDKLDNGVFFEKMKIANGPYIKKDVIKLLSLDGFIF